MGALLRHEQHGPQVGNELCLPGWVQQNASMPQVRVVHHL